MESMQDDFELMFDLLENENKSTITNLQQEKAQNDEENKQLKEKRAKLETEINHDNDLNYDSPKDEDGDNNDINYDLPEEDDDSNDINYASPDDDDANNDINYDSPGDDDDTNDNTNYDTECSDDEEDTTHNTSKAVNQNPDKFVSNEVFADPNYDSSDNEDRTNDICLD